MLRYTRGKGLLALTLFTGRKVAFALLSFLCLKQARYLPITSLEGAGVPPQLQKLRGGGLALSAPGCFIAVLPTFAEKRPTLAHDPCLPVADSRGVLET